MTFDEWEEQSEVMKRYGDCYNYGDGDVYNLMEKTWNYQQQRIDKLEKKLRVTVDTALRRGKILEQQFNYYDE